MGAPVDGKIGVGAGILTGAGGLAPLSFLYSRLQLPVFKKLPGPGG